MTAESVTPWVSFCISTYKRPVFLRQQIASLLQQEDPGFEIVISDNDPESSARDIVSLFQDERIRYFKNDDNLGMIKSFNKSIERARTAYITMVTDDDPIDKSFLKNMRSLKEKFPGYSLYGGFFRVNKDPLEVEKIEKDHFLQEILDPQRTSTILWSSCILNRAHAMEAGKIPDFGSPHLADHALLVLTGSQHGGVITNTMFSSLSVHETNFSKLNFSTYVQGCKGFYETMSAFIAKTRHPEANSKAVENHLAHWFIPCIFNLKKYYTIKKDKEKLTQIDECASQILALPFMKSVRGRFIRKELALWLKKTLGILRA